MEYSYYCYSGLLWRSEDGGAARNGTVFQHYIVQQKQSLRPSGHVWGVDPLDMPRTPSRPSEGKRSQ